MRWCVWLVFLLISPQCVAEDWWWKDYTPQYNQSNTLHDPSAGQSVNVLENPCQSGSVCNATTAYGPDSSLSTQPPVILTGMIPIGAAREISAGTVHSLVLLRDGTVYGAGDNTYGQLGTADNSTLLSSWTKGATGMQDIVACSYFSMAIDTSGTVWETGDNTWGEQGYGPNSPSPNTWHKAWKKDSSGNVSNMDNTTHIACGERHALAIRNDGTLWAIGDGTYGQTGRGDTPDYWQPVFLPNNVVPATAVAGAYHSLVIGADQNVYGTGANDAGQLSVQQIGNFSPFGEVLQGPVVMVAAGYRHSIAVMDDGSLMVTGDNSYGQLGTNNNQSSSGWKQQPGFSNITQVAARGNQSFLIANQQLYATGDNSAGQLGLSGPQTAVKSWAATLTPVSVVAPGEAHTLVINAANQQVWAAGDNSYGRLGVLNPTPTNTPPWVMPLQ